MDSLYNKWSWENWSSAFRNMKHNSYLISLTKVNSHCIKDMSLGYEVIKLLKKTWIYAKTFWIRPWCTVNNNNNKRKLRNNLKVKEKFKKGDNWRNNGKCLQIINSKIIYIQKHKKLNNYKTKKWFKNIVTI